MAQRTGSTSPLVFDVAIEKLVHGGAGLGHYQGKAVFVPFTAPGDLVRARQVRICKDFLEAEILEVLSPSTARAQPFSPVFGECGGCQWQHIQYPYQLQSKEEIFMETLRRLGGIQGYIMDPPIPAEQPMGCRSRVRLQVRGAGGRRIVGFFRMGSSEVVDIRHCPSATAGINGLLGSLRSFLSAESLLFGIGEVELTVGETGEATLLFHSSSPMKAHDARLLLQKALELDGVRAVAIIAAGIRRVTGSFPVLYGLPVGGGNTISFRISPLAFMQANYAANRHLVRTVIQYAEPDPEDFILDLFCGAGNFSLPLAYKAGEVIGVDLSAEAIGCARLNASENRIENLQFIRQGAHTALDALLMQRRHPGVVVLDPPRAGARRVVERLADLSPRRIVYVSCDPATLARDLKILCSANYQVSRATVVDMFPQTSHIESVTLVERS
jgi:23S rRNA (uracil1939-C5)-methyltransferase